MSIPDIHPEDLLDRASDELTVEEAARLQAHLEACSVCRFEQQLRLDFDAEMAAERGPADSTRPGEALRPVEHPAWTLSGVMRDAAIAGPLSSEALRAAGKRGGGTPSVRPLGAGVLRLSRRGGLVAAVVLFAGGAAAAAGWEALPSLITPTKTPAPPPAVLAPTSATPTHAATPPRARRPAPAPAPAPEVSPEIAEETKVVDDEPQPTSTTRDGRTHPPRAEKRSAPPESDQALPRASAKPAAAGPEAAPTSATSDPGELFRTATAARQNKDYPTAIAAYRRIIRQHPGSAQARISRALLARLQLDLGRNKEAASGFEAVAKQSGPLSETALVGRARALRRLGRTQEEASVWQRLLRRYPTSAHRAVANARLRALQRR